MFDNLHLNPLEKLALKFMIEGEPVFQSRTVHDMIWGYPDTLTKEAYKKHLAPSPEFGLFVNVSVLTCIVSFVHYIY